MVTDLSRLRLTYEDHLGFPDDGRRHELIDGDHFVTPAPNLRHQTVASNLHALLQPFVRRHRLGRVWFAAVDVVLSQHDVVQPDLLFVSRERADRLTDEHVRGAPDLVVEILSPGTRRRDEITKRHLYERYGVAEYWIVDPEIETLKVYRLGSSGFERAAELSAEAGDVLESPLFPGLGLPLAEIFEGA